MNLHKSNTITNTTFHNDLAKIFLQFEPISEDLTQLLQACYSPITSDIELEDRMKILDELFSYAKTEDDLPALFAHLITDRVYEYEQKHLDIPSVKPSETLAFFMQERGIKPKDLSEIAPQNVISEILNEKREMTVEQIKGFAKFFGVPETTFLG
ncbi:MAG: transcriptional regulator [Pseudomonadota bacterium]